MRLKHATIALMLLLAIPTPALVRADPPSEAKLAQDRADTAARIYPHVLVRYKQGLSTGESVAMWSARWLEAVVDQPGVKPAAVKQALADHVQRMRDFEAEATKRASAGLADQSEVDSATYYRLDAELAQARGKLR